jgi:hypothetical protein
MHMPAIAKPLEPVFRLFQGNYNQLIQFLKFVEQSPERFELWSQRNNYWFLVQEETTRLFYNFTVSAVTFIQRTDDHFMELSEIDELSTLINEYKQEKKKRFEQSGKHQLIHGIRQYLVHANMLEIGGIYMWDREHGHKHTIVISTETLLTGNASNRRGHGFNKLARKELMNQGAAIGVRNLIEEYYSYIEEFHRWLWDKQAELIKKGIITIRITSD